MKYCCEKFKRIDRADYCDTSPFNSVELDVDSGHRKGWELICNIDMDSSGCKYTMIDYCPFCGKKLGG